MTITLIGTSHIAKQSINEITEAINNHKPDIIAVELDVQRAAALLQKKKNKVGLRQILSIGVKGFIFVKLGQFVQEKLGKKVGVMPGSDMKTAIEIAGKNKIEIAFIDQPISITLKRFSKNLTWKERWRFFIDLFKGLFFGKKAMKELGISEFDLTKVPEREIIKKMMGQLKKRYPSVYRVFVSERNKYMVRQLISLVRKNPGKKILAVVGAGHKEGMEKLLLKVDILR